jgi:hypothetical protein
MAPGGPVSTSRLRHVRDIPGADAYGGRRAADVRWASLVGHSIECFDFYIYATSAVLVFPQLFFPAENPTAATPQSPWVGLYLSGAAALTLVGLWLSPVRRRDC